MLFFIVEVARLAKAETLGLEPLLSCEGRWIGLYSRLPSSYASRHTQQELNLNRLSTILIISCEMTWTPHCWSILIPCYEYQ